MRGILVVAAVVGLGSAARAEPAAPVRPTTVVYVIDRAMPVEKLAVVTGALAEAVDRLEAVDSIAVIGAGRTASVEVPLQVAAAARRKNIAASIAAITWSERSNLTAAVARAAAVITADPGAVRRVVLVTDNPSLAALEAPIRALHRKGIAVSAFAYQTSNATALARLAAIGGGAHAVCQKPGQLRCKPRTSRSARSACPAPTATCSS